jgi:L-seryl-tRNA(Ser) seleniumtransferase
LLKGGLPRWALTWAIRAEVENRREAILGGSTEPPPPIDVEALEARGREQLRPAMRPVLNATGVVVHTNLGRSPLSQHALSRLVEIARGYSNLEYRLEQGQRGSRHDHLRKLASSLCGADDAVIINNNAGAVLLTVSALAVGKEVVVSRGELVEIGGGFRIPDVIVQGGALLREVGTTNRTRISDYSEAVGPETAAFLKVHRSNFDVVGFTEEVDIKELAALGRTTGLPVIADLGSGAMMESYGPGLSGEPVIRRALTDGADLVCFSGDKLLGGPQAGLVIGRAELVERVRRHPLMRALRPCKLTLAALEATLELWRDGRIDEIPIARMLGQLPEAARQRASHLSRRIRRLGVGWSTDLVSVMGRAGGGSMPLRSAPGWAIALRFEGANADRIEAALRHGEPPVISRIVDDQVMLDLRTVPPDQERLLLQRIRGAAQSLSDKS